MNKKILFFDGECNLCNGFVDFMIRRMPGSEMRVASLQGSTAKELVPDGANILSTLIYLDHGRTFTHSEAAIRAVSDLGGAWSLFRIFLGIPAFIRDCIYRAVAKNRYRWFGRRATCRVPTPNEQAYFLD